jgi:hypothetical protein
MNQPSTLMGCIDMSTVKYFTTVHFPDRPRSTPLLLALGFLAGPVYLLTGMAQALTRPGFDIRRHALSHLSNGNLGWIQIANFLVSGVLVIAGAIGVRRALRSEWGGTWGPILLAGYGAGMLGAGIFVADPAAGFPPGAAAAPAGLSRDGLLHFVFGGIGFYSLMAACFVFARRFARLARPRWAVYSAFTGVVFFLAFVAVASGSTAPAVMLTFYAAVAWVWVWHTFLLASLWMDRPA